MFGNNSNQPNNGVNTNTSIKMYFGDNASLNVGAWNNGQLAIKFTPCVGVDQNGMRQYDNNRKVGTALVLDKAKTLKEAVDKYITPAIEAYRSGSVVDDISVSVSMGTPERKNVLAIEYKNGDDGKKYVHITLYHMVSPDNRTTPENIFTYKFAEQSFVTNFDAANGVFGEEVYVDSEWLSFYDILEQTSLLTTLNSHAIRYSTELSAKYSNSRGYNNSYNRPQTSNMGFMEIPNGTPDELPFA